MSIIYLLIKSILILKIKNPSIIKILTLAAIMSKSVNSICLNIMNYPKSNSITSPDQLINPSSLKGFISRSLNLYTLLNDLILNNKFIKTFSKQN